MHTYIGIDVDVWRHTHVCLYIYIYRHTYLYMLAHQHYLEITYCWGQVIKDSCHGAQDMCFVNFLDHQSALRAADFFTEAPRPPEVRALACRLY